MERSIESGPTAPAEDKVDAAEKFARLDQLVRSLVDRYHQLARAHDEAVARLAERDEQIRDLNQRRQDAGKRLDEVLSRLDQLDSDLERRLSLPAIEE